MKIIIEQNKLSAAYPILLRQAGYSYMENRRGGEDSFVRTFGRSPYPRFHLYVDDLGDKLSFNLHLDQKKPTYGGATAHSGEYDSDIIKQEVDRLKTFLR